MCGQQKEGKRADDGKSRVVESTAAAAFFYRLPPLLYMKKQAQTPGS